MWAVGFLEICQPSSDGYYCELENQDQSLNRLRLGPRESCGLNSVSASSFVDPISAFGSFAVFSQCNDSGISLLVNNYL